MSDKNTLTIDALSIENSQEQTVAYSSDKGNTSLKLLFNNVFQKSKSALFALVGLVFFAGFWSLVSYFTEQALPGPVATLTVLRELLSDPFYDYGPNDKGIGLQLFTSGHSLLKTFKSRFKDLCL